MNSWSCEIRMSLSKSKSYKKKTNSFEFWEAWNQGDFCSFISSEAVQLQRRYLQLWSWILLNLRWFHSLDISPQPEQPQSFAKTQEDRYFQVVFGSHVVYWIIFIIWRTVNIERSFYFFAMVGSRFSMFLVHPFAVFRSADEIKHAAAQA